MLEKIRGISNPLTVIAIFAGITEVGGTIVLPFLSTTNQDKYLWFLMIFPSVLVILFFITLLFRHNVLYAPSDYRTDASFLEANNIQNNQLNDNPVGINISEGQEDKGVSK